MSLKWEKDRFREGLLHVLLGLKRSVVNCYSSVDRSSRELTVDKASRNIPQHERNIIFSTSLHDELSLLEVPFLLLKAGLC